MEENKNIEPEQPAENIPQEIIPAIQTTVPEIEETIIAEQQPAGSCGQTENMEVHHHTHPDSHRDHGKKNWKTYFWEFLMLFLAVFCSFLAEYQLEIGRAHV